MDFKTKRLLFIDSREAYRNIFCELLREAGYDVAVSSSASEALETVLRDSFDLV
ncbi:MAG: sigma-54-dependent Fis family transcriptional regulator, partial [Deltaproteobacteria bacterium]|nr:sigma-54-dependent Fis family transcriptional regulator [Deltaproteobacteria bacterium]